VQPEDILTTLAELGVAVAGFSGIVVVLGERVRGESPRDRPLLDALLWASAGVVLWALAPLLLLSAQLSERTTWVVSSAGWSVQQSLVLALRAYQIRRAPDVRPELTFVVPVSLGGVSALGLQLASVAWLASAWPHLVALVWWLVLSFVIFLRLMRAGDGEA
jgi:hypothetical protein